MRRSNDHGNQIKISNQYKNQYTVAALQQVNEVNQDGIFQRTASTVEISSQDRLLGLTVEDNTILLHLEPLHDTLLGQKLWETNLADLHRKTDQHWSYGKELCTFADEMATGQCQ